MFSKLASSNVSIINSSLVDSSKSDLIFLAKVVLYISSDKFWALVFFILFVNIETKTNNIIIIIEAFFFNK
jgi:hypothetical protein